MINGREYIKRIDALQNEVWIDGGRCSGKLSQLAPFKGILKSKAALYDYQCKPENQELFRYSMPDRKGDYGFSYHQPTSIEDLTNRRLATQEWARLSAGLMGRSPDYMNTLLMTLGFAAPHFAQDQKGFGDNIKRLYEKAREKDLSITHTFINPQVNRSVGQYFDDTNVTAAKVVEEKEEGIVIKGARLLATQGGLTDELLVLPAGGYTLDDAYLFGFMIPSNSKGLKFICRESFCYRDSRFDHPLASQFEEIDSIVVFEDVLVPWECVFLYKDAQVVGEMEEATGLYTFLQFQAVCRQVVKVEYILGLCELMGEAIQIQEYEHIKLKMSEIITTLEIMKALLVASEVNSRLNQYGTLVPESQPLKAAIQYFSGVYPRLMEIIQLLGASGLISIPTEKDFNSEIQEDLAKYLQGANINAKERVQLFRMAWDLGMSAFGSRQTQFERFFFGDPIRLSTIHYNRYFTQPYVDMVQAFLNKREE
ncbi:4-hydroxyphenylacetate 3-monooxygenase, oxygenase component [Bacillus hwajinpoensis]|uniref:4-hydroxyphenylacetate 3-monooxygenase, oxygenase component n=1 Tax=Guptibacillus hwajinpoensis TaxID=208199 RepID=A0A845EVN8_9BACL|nr:4-hydroxyphenylacetate 3-monooxygenase, oxygenase component [Pseudalkalibacillus hwajinpoensis]MYL61885.1 4-hydroxyphenylacetate 3-monooxygenase, oxygenase component [Pseudalkalibacillus hwajinpoensis]